MVSLHHLYSLLWKWCWQVCVVCHSKDQILCSMVNWCSPLQVNVWSPSAVPLNIYKAQGDVEIFPVKASSITLLQHLSVSIALFPGMLLKMTIHNTYLYKFALACKITLWCFVQYLVISSMRHALITNMHVCCIACVHTCWLMSTCWSYKKILAHELTDAYKIGSNQSWPYLVMVFICAKTCAAHFAQTRVWSSTRISTDNGYPSWKCGR